MKRTLSIIAMIAVVLSLLVGACGPKPVATETVTPAVTTKPTWQEDWERTVVAARKEGTVVVYTGYTATWRQALSEATAQKYGITVEGMTARGEELSERIINEQRNKMYVGDVAVFGDAYRYFKGQDVLEPLERMLILPEVVDPKNWWRGEFPWIDATKTAVYFIETVTPAIVINTDLVKLGEIKDWKDLLDPKWKGKIIIADPTVVGGGQTAMMFAAYGITGIAGWDFVKAFMKQDLVITRDVRLMAEWLAHGKVAVAMSGAHEVLLQFIREGAPMKQVPFGENTYLLSGNGSVMMLKGAQHPNAAKVFINFLLSKEGTYTSSRATGHQSARVDVPTDHMQPAMVRQPGVQYKWRQNDPVYQAKFDELRNQVVELFKPLVSGR